MVRDTDYAYSVAYMRTLENKMLGQNDIDAIVQMNSVEEAFKYLEDKGYERPDGKDKGTYSKKDIDDLLKNSLELAWKEIREAAPKGAPIDVLLLQNDFHNLKTILKAVFSNSEWESLMFYPNTVEPQDIYDAVSENKLDELPKLLYLPAKEAYEALAGTNDGQAAEIILDKASFGAIRKIAENSKNEFLLGWVELWAKLTDMKIALRGAASNKKQDFLLKAMIPVKSIDVEKLAEAAAQDVSAVVTFFTDDGMEGAAEAAQSSISEFEKWADNQQMEYIKGVQYNTFGFEPLFGFLYGKKAEVQAVRIALYGILNHIARETIKGRLRELYV